MTKNVWNVLLTELLFTVSQSALLQNLEPPSQGWQHPQYAGSTLMNHLNSNITSMQMRGNPDVRHALVLWLLALLAACTSLSRVEVLSAFLLPY